MFVKKIYNILNDILLPFYICEAERAERVCILRAVLRYAQNRVEQCVMRDPRVL